MVVLDPRIKVLFTGRDLHYQEEEIPPHFSTEVKCTLGSGDLGDGTIVITNLRIVFIPSNTEKSCMSVYFRSMVMHAITPEKYIFLQLVVDDDEEEEEESSEENIVKIYLKDPTKVNALFTAINDMSALNPDEDCIEEDQCIGDESSDWDREEEEGEPSTS